MPRSVEDFTALLIAELKKAKNDAVNCIIFDESNDEKKLLVNRGRAQALDDIERKVIMLSKGN
jgi:hypothetical protein